MTQATGDAWPHDARLPLITGRRLWIWAAVAVVGVNVLFFTGASNFLASPQARILNQLLMLGSAAALAIAVRRGAATLVSPLVLPGLALLLATAIAAFLSQRPATSHEALALMLLATPTYLVIRAVTWTDWLRGRLDRLVVVATVVFVVAYLLQAGLEWVRWWSVAGPSIPPLRPGDVGLTVGTVNAVALYLELLVPLAVAIAWSALRRRRLAVLIAVLGAAALVVTGSRGAWLGTAVAVALGGALAWVRAGRPLPGPRGRIVAVVGALVAIPAAVLLGPTLMARLLAGDAGRGELWSAAWSMFTSSPVVGTGPGTFPMLRAQYPISEPNLAVVTTSHNSVLQVLTDTGLLGLIASGLIILVVARLLWRTARSEDVVPSAVWTAVVVSLVAALLHSVVDTQFHIPAVVVMLSLLVARVDVPRASAAERPAAWARVPAVVAVAGLVLGTVVLVRVDLGMVRGALGNAALARGDAATALDDFRAATSLQDIAPYRWGQGLAAASLGDRAEASASLLGAAAQHGLTLFQANAAAMLDGATKGALLDAVEAVGAYDAGATVNVAAMRYPDDPLRATEDLADVMTTVPSLVFSTRPPEVFDDTVWAAAQEQALDRIGAADPATACSVSILGGLERQAGAWCPTVTDPSLSEALALIEDAASSGSADIDRAKALLRREPASAPLHALLWTLAYTVRDQSLANDVANVAGPLFFGLPSPPMELVVHGRPDAIWAWRVARYPMASDFRNGPDRQVTPDMLTIEAVARPKERD